MRDMLWSPHIYWVCDVSLYHLLISQDIETLSYLLIIIDPLNLVCLTAWSGPWCTSQTRCNRCFQSCLDRCNCVIVERMDEFGFDTDLYLCYHVSDLINVESAGLVQSKLLWIFLMSLGSFFVSSKTRALTSLISIFMTASPTNGLRDLQSTSSMRTKYSLLGTLTFMSM